MPEILKIICAFLQRATGKLREESPEVEIGSAAFKKLVVDIIVKEFADTITIPDKRRYWFDFAILENGILVPVRLIFSGLGDAAENMNCKLGLYYALTGKEPPFRASVSWLKFVKMLATHVIQNESNYYFLVIDRSWPDDIFAIGLKEMPSLEPNGDHLPFRCRWKDNRESCIRPPDAANQYLLEMFGASLKLRTKPYKVFKKCFSVHVPCDGPIESDKILGKDNESFW